MQFKKHKINFITLFIIMSLLAMGLFHEFLSCIASVVLCVYIGYTAYKNKKISFDMNLTSIAVASIVFFYGISAFWAIDKGAAVIGFFKVLPLILFLIMIMQQKEEAELFFRGVPYAATAMTVISAILMQFSSLEKYFSVAGRLSGFFQYSNTFALFALVSLILLVTKTNYKLYDYFAVPILVFGILYSGSRTVFVLMIVSLAAVLIFSKNKKLKVFLLIATAFVIGGALIYVAITDNFYAVGRFLTMSLTESTFVGRLLYFRDALPVILRHPFGLGYMGFYYLQQSVQTGVYSIRFVHNDFLQLMLDIGWLPALLFISAIIKAFFKKGASLQKRLLIFVISAHSCFDFDLQYVAIFMLFILLLDCKDGREKTLNISKGVTVALLSIVSLFCIYIGIAQGLSYFKMPEQSLKLYPWNTQDRIELLTQTDNASDMEKIADKIIEQNKYVPVAYSAKALCSYSKGDFEKVIKYKEKAIAAAPFGYSEYEEYCYMLINGIRLYKQAGDDYSAEYCEKALLKAVNRLQQNEERLSRLGRMIKDQPQTELPDEIIEYVGAIQND